MSPGPSVPVKEPSDRKSLHQFLEASGVKQNTAVRKLGAAESKRKAIRYGSMLWSSIPKRYIHTKINGEVKKDIYNWILQHPQYIQSLIENYGHKVFIYGTAETQLVSKLLLQVYV